MNQSLIWSSINDIICVIFCEIKMSIWRNYDISGTTAKTSTEGVPTSTTTGLREKIVNFACLT
jgi:hypothetical protein